jgi:ATP adenylyltransferase/5',5'''-P-1,P-4-tetraphosphate phosphorylase II
MRYKVAHINKLPASLKDDTTRMNDSNKHKVTGQMNHKTTDPKANASVFLFFSNAHFLKTILASRTNGTFGFARHTSRPFAKPKEPFFANAPLKDISLYYKS